ncbi:ribonuclease HI [Brachyspira pilosicoli]|uniref:ribonuclease H n=4 Tax=Brachyspira pilosicoli TaxID=52584 RepID=D8IG34_BRAP9|nr:ribonuclease HI [Brachyspira pilosicoli]ADK32098.1 ribonuclease H [Brachyspira pilosicoli 95/1000]AFR71033.1 ribonuclease H [Brachyspira pilosicoli B2904]AGA66174.1 ribonuclease H [Brachyspira pilosicoli P43/6/78]MBW5382761.1 ribonuclease HI [Brachyspira pilosicoli]MBW5399527.1 ribonuclease HI [Brachyspira pilosicoli]
MQKDNIIIYTDGGCRGNPGIGAWGAILLSEKHNLRLEIGESEEHTTNNKMEMQAAIKALERLKHSHNIKLYSDSAYLVNGMNSWIYSWQKNNWIKSDKKPVENKDYWLKLIELSKKHSIEFIKVKGHSSNKENNRADEIVNILMDEHIKNGSISEFYNKTDIN